MKHHPRFMRGLSGLGLLAGILTIALNATAADEPVPKNRILVDFEDAQSTRLSAYHSQAMCVSNQAGHVLQIVTESTAKWPGVTIEPRLGPWDLTGYNAVEMEVRNPEDIPVRVLLSLNNPGSDGRKNCNTESVTVEERGNNVLVVPFGMWHGSSGHPLDLTNVVSAQILLDQPGRAHRFEVDNLRAVKIEPIDLRKIMKDPRFLQLPSILGRGVNLGNALEAPNEGEWGVTLKESYFKQIKDACFDSVRVPVRWSAHAETSPPYRMDQKFIERVDWVIREAITHKLQVVVNMHHYDELFNQPEAHRERFLAMWKQISERYKNQPPELKFELLNEPNGKLLANKWNRLLEDALMVIRSSNPTREIVVGSAGWNSISELKNLKLPETDRHLIVTFHYYSPFQFTHQGASWAGAESKQWLGTKWMGTESEQQAIERDFDLALDWAVKHGRPLYLGEFGAFNTADMESRARWIRFVAESARKRKIGFAYWEFCSGFGVYDSATEHWIEPLKAALLP